MSIQPVTINQCKCERCGHSWTSKIEPKQCARCRSPYWNRPRVRPAKKNGQETS